METVLITGGTGLVGNQLRQALLAKGYRVIILTRQGEAKKPGSSYLFAQWNVEKQTIDEWAIAEADYIIHLAGAGVADKRWTEKRKQEIVKSRVNGSKLIADSLKMLPNKVKAIISASAIGWYGPDPSIPNPAPFTENDPADDSFLGDTCKKWEEIITTAEQVGKRVVRLRTGIVLSNSGGALQEFKKPLNFGVAAILGNGKQIISWIHIDDLVQMYIAAIENEKMRGAYNAVAPDPISNKQFTLYLARKKKFFIPVHVPSFILKLVLGEMSIEVLKSATVSCYKILASGYVFQYPTHQSALDDLCKK
ncbi:TIGR01777 family protein [Chitinophagaceae bacterium IBVUCB2]|nr:TIGR01777 family protein [Chitinophagaceae bacterium IBVUCB2]